MWKRVISTSENRVSPNSIDSSWSWWRSFLCGNGSFPHGNDFIPPGNDSIPHRNEPKPTVGGSKPIRSRSNRYGNDRKPHGGAAKPIGFVAKFIGFAPTPHRFAANPSRKVFVRDRSISVFACGFFFLQYRVSFAARPVLFKASVAPNASTGTKHVFSNS